MLPDDFRQLICALQYSWHAHCSLPVVIGEALLVGQLCNGLQWQFLYLLAVDVSVFGVVVYQSILDGGRCALVNHLWGQVEVDWIILGHLHEDNWARTGVVDCLLVAILAEVVVSAIDLLVDCKVYHLWTIVGILWHFLPYFCQYNVVKLL